MEETQGINTLRRPVAESNADRLAVRQMVKVAPMVEDASPEVAQYCQGYDENIRWVAGVYIEAYWGKPYCMIKTVKTAGRSQENRETTPSAGWKRRFTGWSKGWSN